MFQLMSFFRILRTEKHVIHIAPFRFTSYVLKSFGCLEVCNRVSNRNKGKKLIFVGSILPICQLEIPLSIYKLMCQSSFWIHVSYGFCEFNRVASRNRANSYFSKIIISNMPTANTGFILHVNLCLM